MKQTLFGIWMILAGSICVISCGHSKKSAFNPNAPVAVNMIVVHAQPVTYYDQFPGTTNALSQVDIRAVVQGYVTGIFFKEGDHVHKGQKLYEIDNSLYRASYDQAVAGVKVAQGNLDQAQKDADRYVYLDKYDAIAKQVLDHALITLQNSKNQVNSAKQDLVKAETNLKYATIVAPFDGTIGFSQVKLGNTVDGSTVLNTISTDDPMAVDFVINEKQLSRFIEIKKNPENNTDDSLFTILLPNGKLYEHSGKLSIIDRGVDPQTGSIRIRVVFANPDLELRTGMSCVMRVHNENAAPQLTIPTKAITENMGEYFVFLAKDTVMNAPGADTAKRQKGNGEMPALRAVQRKIITGQLIGANTVVKGGLQEGDTVITDGIQKLHEGSPINTGNTAAPQDGKAASGK